MSDVKTRIHSLRVKVLDGIDFTLDRLFSEAQDTYFLYEEQLEELDRLLANLLEEANRTGDKVGMSRLFERLQFLEDRFEEIDSALRGRPKRVRRRFTFSDFFRNGWGSNSSESSVVSAGIATSVEAYRILGVEAGSALSVVTTAFRKSVKSFHPDARGGDRSAEPELRKLIAAYQFIKRELTGKG